MRNGEIMQGINIMSNACVACGDGPIPQNRTHCPRHTEGTQAFVLEQAKEALAKALIIIKINQDF